jgi:hypothetical protein
MTTSTEPSEEVEVPHLKERLWHELAELHAEQRRSSTATRDTGDELMRRRARRSVRLAGIGAGAAAVLVAGVFAAQLVGTGSDQPAGPRPEAVLIERVATSTEDALAESIVHTVDDQVSPDGARRTIEMWHDETTGIARILDRDVRGNPVIDVGPLTGPTLESPAYSGQRVVDYCTQGYLENADTGEASTDLGAGVVDVRDLIADGELVADGTEMVDGRELIRLRGIDSEGGDYVLLVDPDTYRVVGQRGTFSTGETYTTDYEYLPRTAESLDLLHPPIPDGFTQAAPSELAPPAGSCEGS